MIPVPLGHSLAIATAAAPFRTSRRAEMDGRGEDDRVPIPLLRLSVYLSVCERAACASPNHLHIHYRRRDSIIAPRGNEDLFCLAFVILIGGG